MAGTGGLVGAIAGVILVLLSHIVLGMNAGIMALIPGSVGVGTLASMFLGIFLMARHAVPLAWQSQPRLVPLLNSESEQVSQVSQAS